MGSSIDSPNTGPTPAIKEHLNTGWVRCKRIVAIPIAWRNRSVPDL